MSNKPEVNFGSDAGFGDDDYDGPEEMSEVGTCSPRHHARKDPKTAQLNVSIDADLKKAFVEHCELSGRRVRHMVEDLLRLYMHDQKQD